MTAFKAILLGLILSGVCLNICAAVDCQPGMNCPPPPLGPANNDSCTINTTNSTATNCIGVANLDACINCSNVSNINHCENCSGVNNSATCLHCDHVFNVSSCEGCNNVTIADNCTNCNNTLNVTSCINCLNGTEVGNCTNCAGFRNVMNCTNCSNVQNVTANCTFCKGVMNVTACINSADCSFAQNCINSTNCTIPPFDAKGFCAPFINNFTFPAGMSNISRTALISSVIDKIGDARVNQNATDSALLDLLNSTLGNATQDWIKANTVPPPVDNSSVINGLFIAHLSEIPGNHTQHVMQLLTMKVANASSSMPIDPMSGLKVMWTCNRTGLFGNNTNNYTSADNTLSNFDISLKVRDGDIIQFNATVQGNNTVVVLQKVIRFVGIFPNLTVVDQADDSAAGDSLGVRRLVFLAFNGIPEFLNTTVNGSIPVNATFETISLNASIYNYNIKIPINLRDPLVLKVVQPIKPVVVKIRASLPGCSLFFETTFVLNTSSVQANLPSTNFNLSTLTPTADNIGDLGASLANKVGSLVDQVAGNLSGNASMADAKAACTSGGGTWNDGNLNLRVPPSCKPAISATDKAQIQDLCDKTLAAFSADPSSYSADDQISFLGTMATARKNGVDIPGTTISTAFDTLATACQNISQTLLLSGDSDGGTTLKSSMKSILSARTTLAESDAQKVSDSTTDASTLETSMTNQRKSLAIIDEVLAAFSAARTAVGGSMTISNGEDTIHSEDLCLSTYASQDDSYLIGISINPQDDPDATTTTKFGFYITKATLRAIISDKTGNSTDCLNIGGIKTSKAAGGCGYQGADKMSQEIVGFKVFDSSGSTIDVTGYTLYIEVPLGNINVTDSFKPACKYLNTSSEIPADGGSFFKLGANGDTALMAINHLSSYALSSDTSSSSSSSSTSTTSSNNTNTVALSAVRLDTNIFVLAVLAIFGLILLN